MQRKIVNREAQMISKVPLPAWIFVISKGHEKGLLEVNSPLGCDTQPSRWPEEVAFVVLVAAVTARLTAKGVSRRIAPASHYGRGLTGGSTKV